MQGIAVSTAAAKTPLPQDVTFKKNVPPLTSALPYPKYALLQRAGRLVWDEHFLGGAWLVSHFDDVRAALHDKRLSVKRTSGWINLSAPKQRHQLNPLKRQFNKALLFVDGAPHQALRKLIVQAMRQSTAGIEVFIEQEATSLLNQAKDDFEQYGQIDWVTSVAQPLPIKVMQKLLGIEEGLEQGAFTECANALARFIGSSTLDEMLALNAQHALEQMTDALSPWMQSQRGNLLEQSPKNIAQHLLLAEHNGDIEDSETSLVQCAMLLFAGFETTRHLLSNGFLTLLRHPKAWRAIVARADLIPPTIRELLRFDSPVQYTARRVVTDFSWHGYKLKRGQLVVPLIGAAHHDEQQYKNPECFDPLRTDCHHLAFGTGPHVCLGASLTLMEAEILFRKVAQTWPDIVDLSFTEQYHSMPLYRGLTHLHFHI